MTTVIHQQHIPADRRGLKLLLSIKKDPLSFFTRLANKEGAFAWLSIKGKPLVMLNDASGIEYVLQKNSASYCKGDFNKILEPLFGDSMFLSEGPTWRERREKAAPVFANGNFEEMLRQMVGAVEAMFDRWQPRINRGEPIDITLEMTRFALDALLRALYHESRDEVAKEMRESLGVILRDAEERMWSSISLPKFIAYRVGKYRTALRFLKRIVSDLIASRRASKTYPDDLLSRLVDDFGISASEQKLLYDEVLSFLLAGHDTTAHGLAWSIYNLSLHPHIQENLENEVDKVLGNSVPTMETIKRLTYTRQIFDEILRLFPPVWTMSREALASDEVPLDDGSKLAVPAGSAVMMCHYAVHRREKYWPDPEVFDPSRFSPDKSEGRPKFAWFPFGGGPRLCLGFRFAQIESVLALAMIAQRYKFTLISGQYVRPEPIITLRPAGAILLKMIPRHTTANKLPIAPMTKSADTKIQKVPANKCPFHSMMS